MFDTVNKRVLVEMHNEKERDKKGAYKEDGGGYKGGKEQGKSGRRGKGEFLDSKKNEIRMPVKPSVI